MPKKKDKEKKGPKAGAVLTGPRLTNVDHIEVFQGEDKQWYWRAAAGNGEIVATGESHTRPADAERAADAVFPEIKQTRV